MVFRLNIFGSAPPPPKTLRYTVAVYPDGHEYRIVPDKSNRGMWTYNRHSSAGPGKANAIRSAESEGATIVTRTVPNPNYRAPR